MRKSLLFVVIMLAFNSLFAGPVDSEYAKFLGEKFVKANFEQRQNSTLDLAYTVKSDFGVPCFYVFNVSDYGFVFVSADDCARPILAYSEESAFDLENLAPGLGFMMDEYKYAIAHGIETNAVATVNIAAEWKSLENIGKLKPAMRGIAVEPLCTTKWNQSWPYNAYCPEQPAAWASNGHVVVGCVATAMSQVMKYWNHPVQGQGTHTYNAPMYGQQTANFGETTYDWENMPNSLSSTSPQEEIDAVGILSYHCGVSVDMMYDINGDGSGAHSTDVPAAIQNYFRYAPSYVTSYSNYDTWMSLLKEAIDMRRPVYYSGCSEGGCHAFVCDGYDENELYHFNYGWGGSGDGYFAPNAIEYSHHQVQAIFNMMPLEVYNNTAKAPTAMSVEPAANNALSATITWTNPTQTMSNSALPSTIEKMVVERNGKIIHIEENTAAGATVTFVDEDVPCFSSFTYQVYALIEDAHGQIAKVENVFFGPTCEWKLMIQSSAFQGMRGASISAYDAAGAELGTFTTSNSSMNTFDIAMPLGGPNSFTWSPITGNQEDYNISIVIKDANNQTVYDFDGNTADIPAGTFYVGENNCGNSGSCDAPANLYATQDGETIVLSWEGTENPGYGYNIYRDGLLYKLTTETTFVDDDVPNGGHCYYVTALCESGNSEPTNESCAVAMDGCEAPTELWYELTSTMKPKLTWVAPENEALSGFYVYRKTNDDGEWTRVKLLGPNKTDYTDNSALTEGNWYYYRIQAYYEDIDCLSAPAQSKYSDLEYFVKIYYSTTDVEDNDAQKVAIYPNPANESMTIAAKGITNISVVNLVGQKVFESSLYSDKVVLNMSDYEAGIYIVRITTDEFEVTKRVSVVH